jgi:hypothetical protein
VKEGIFQMTDPTPPVTRYVTLQQLAEETGISAASIRAALDRGEMPFLRAGRGRGGTFHIERVVFEQWLRSRTQQAGRDDPKGGN